MQIFGDENIKKGEWLEAKGIIKAKGEWLEAKGIIKAKD